MSPLAWRAYLGAGTLAAGIELPGLRTPVSK